MKYLILATALFIVCGCEKDVKEVLAPPPQKALPAQPPPAPSVRSTALLLNPPSSAA